MTSLPYQTILSSTSESAIDIQIRANAKGSIVVAVDSTGIKVTNRGDWMRHKWNGMRKGFLKIHVGVDVETKEVLAIKITDEHSHDSRHLKYLTEKSARSGTIIQSAWDGVFDSIFSYVNGIGAIPAILVRKNAIPNAKGCHARKSAVISQIRLIHGVLV